MFENYGNQSEKGCILVVFGGTGDLAMRKLLPAAYSLMGGRFSENFAVVLIGRREKDETQFANEVRETLRLFSREPQDKARINFFISKVFYRKFDFIAEEDGYPRLDIFLRELDGRFGTSGNRLFYLAVAPEYFGVILQKLEQHRMLQQEKAFWRVLVEKPFGSGLDNARALDRKMNALIDEENIYRVDHYLGKSMIQNIIAVRFGNAIFESLWSHRFIDHVQITVFEQLGVESRGGYYDKAGILNDMLQNHLLQMLSIVAMEPPAGPEPEDLRKEKIKVLQALRPFDGEKPGSCIVLGQYGEGSINGTPVPAYRAEEKVRPGSDTDTFVALKVFVDNERWKGVPFYIRSGKRMNSRKTEIVIQFKNLSFGEGFNQLQKLEPNLLVFAIQPREGFYFRINSKTPGSEFDIEPVQLDYCQSCRTDVNSPEAYEILLQEAAAGNASFFTSWEELECSWEYVESIQNALKGKSPEYPNYKAGTEGPTEAAELLLRDGRHWWDLD